jgi:RAQPRD family integrative conjugative element protein
MPNRHTLHGVAALLMCCSTTYASALLSDDEHQRLVLIGRQLDAIARTSSPVTSTVTDPKARYIFDYARFSADIDLIRQGINGYLTPSRAQPRNPPELTGHYTRSTKDQP